MDYDKYELISKYYHAKIVKYLGFKGIVNDVNVKKSNVIMLVLFILLLFLYTRIIINIEVLTNNQELYSLVLNELDRENVVKYSILKSDICLEKVEKAILERNRGKIEWLNIKRKGMKYVVNLEPKVSKDPLVGEEYCHIVAAKDAMITKIYSSKGVELKEVNESVKKGDILISGDIKKDEEVKGNVCASGKVYGNTWYTIDITIPKQYETYELLDKKKYNILFEFNNKKWSLFKSQFEDYQSFDKKIVNIFGLEINLRKEILTKSKQVEYSDSELDLKIDELVEEKMSDVLKGDSRIVMKKVLKKTDNNSTIYLEVFIVAEEEISEQVLATNQPENE